MQVTAALVKELREKTGAGMMDCKKALVESAGDLEKAVDYLRKKGLAAAAKKSGRVAAEGLVASYITQDKKIGALVEVNCETDFVAKVDDFKQFTEELAEHIAVNAPAALSREQGEEGPFLLEQTFKNGLNVQQTLHGLITGTGENIVIRRFIRFEVDGPGLVQDYNHLGGKIGVLLELALDHDGLADNEEVAVLAKDLAMQVAAARPEYVNREDVGEETLEREKSIYKAQALNEGKPETIAEKITRGRLEKFFKEACLMEQEFIKDTNLTVKKLLAQVEKKIGAGIKIKRFARYEKGEGVAKKDDDFVGEVMSQLK